MGMALAWGRGLIRSPFYSALNHKGLLKTQRFRLITLYICLIPSSICGCTEYFQQLSLHLPSTPSGAPSTTPHPSSRTS